MQFKTEFKYSYEPIDLFEEATTITTDIGVIVMDGGQATLNLAQPTERVEPAFVEDATTTLRSALQARQLLIHRPFSLNGPTISHEGPDGRRGTVMMVMGARIAIQGYPPDVLVTDAEGQVIKDTRAERLSQDRDFVENLAARASGCPSLRRMLQSYSRAVSDPDDELVHLYEVRDAAAEPYSNEGAARSALGIGKADWSTLGRLANNEPLRQGRHRGRQSAELRNATEDELKNARRVACQIIAAFASTV
ncbi:MAG: hypothetical protein ACHQ50_00405 [Fimbriimonadales bacterium]